MIPHPPPPTPGPQPVADRRPAGAGITLSGVTRRYGQAGAAITALDNVLAPLLPMRIRPDPQPKAVALLDAVGLAGRERSTPAQLSGDQQRVAIARALINDPIVVLADEPTGNLDTTTGADIITLLLDMRARHGTTLLIATHDPTIAARCDRTIHLADGQVSDPGHRT